MSTKLEYLKKCITSGKVIGSKRWYISCFAIPLLKEESYDSKEREQYSIIVKIDGLYYLDYTEEEVLTPVKIVDYIPNQPLFSFQDKITVDSSWLPSIHSSQETKIGILIVNAVVIYPSLKTKVNYINNAIKVSDIESLLVNKVKNDDVATDKDIRVSEMTNCIDRLNFLSNLATIINIAATPKAITPPPGIKEKKKELLKKYEGQLNDPVKVVELESELSKIDNEYLADDPAAKNIFNKKSKTARKKLFLMFGETADFINTNEGKVVLNSLAEGISTSKEDFPKYMNDLRSGSFDRGASTALAGYSYKILQRSLSGIKILNTPCNTTKGIKRLITNSNYKKIINRYVKEKGWKLVSDIEIAKGYIGQEVEIRSVMYCKAPDNTICYACMSENYKNTPTATTTLAANISSVLLNTFLKKMHSSGLDTGKIDMKDLCV